MRLLKIALILLSLLLLIPLATAQEIPAGGGPGIDIIEPLSLQTIIEEYGCPVGIRDANRDLLINEDGLVEGGQRVLIPRNSPLCEIEYYGEIEFLDWPNGSFPGSYWELAAYYNVCEDLLWELNPEWNSYTISSTTARIPLDAPECFETVELAAGQTPQNLALEYNVCENVVWYYNDVQIYQASSEARSVYLPLERYDCYLDGQVLLTDIYPGQSEGDYIPAEIVRPDTAQRLWDFAIENSYCYWDIEAANRGKAMMGSLQEVIYIPEGTRHCEYLHILMTIENTPTSIAELAFERNICLESLIDVNRGFTSWTALTNESDSIWLPQEAPCYDANGLRIGHNDRLVHESSKDNWLFGIAQEYGVCVADLFAENPLLENYPRVDLPSVIFIPEKPCSDVDEAGFVNHIVREAEISNNKNDIYWISTIYNVCMIEIIRANPQILVDRPANETDTNNPSAYTLRDLQAGETLLIPLSRPCYDFYIPMAGFGHYHGLTQDSTIVIPYICYAEAINPEQDYTGHEPAISPIANTAESNCYDQLANPYVVLDNLSYTLYPMYGDMLLADVAACFGVNIHDIVTISHADLGVVRSDYPTDVPRYWGIANPSLDCPMIGTDRNAAVDWLRIQREQTALGTLNENSEYGVQYGDTLYSIGLRYGYLPEWIMAENNLPDDMIFVRQILRLPSYPNLYQIGTYGGATGGGVLLFLGASFALRLRANRRKGKKKNDELTA